MQAKKNSDSLAELARSTQQTRDTALLRATTELFVHDLTHDRDEIRRYEELATHFLPKVSIGDRAHVAERLAICSDAPPSVIRMLARDVIDVAAPVIRGSTVLEPLDLLTVIAATGVEHHRLIASRPGLADQVKRALVLTGDPEVVGCLEEGPAVRAPAAADDGGPSGTHAPAQPRRPATPDLHREPDDFLRLDRPARLKILVDLATRPQARRYGGSANRLDQAFRSILGAAKTVGYARTGQHGQLIAAIADGLGLQPGFVTAALDDATGEPLAVMLRGLRLDDVQAQQVFLLASPAGRDTATFFPLADLYAGMEPAVAETLCEIWRTAKQEHGTHHVPHLADGADDRQSGIAHPAGQTSTVPAEQARRA